MNSQCLAHGQLYFLLVFVSHPMLDAIPAYSEGVMFFAPITFTMWKVRWTPIDGIGPEVVAL